MRKPFSLRTNNIHRFKKKKLVEKEKRVTSCMEGCPQGTQLPAGTSLHIQLNICVKKCRQQKRWAEERIVVESEGRESATQG